MKQNIKQLVFSNDNFFRFFVKIIYRLQINKLVNNNMNIEKKYKKKVKMYWKQYGIIVNINWHKWYTASNGIADERYIPEDIFYTFIEPFYNNMAFKKAYEDKAFYNIWFPNIQKPFTIAKNINGDYYDDQLNLISEELFLERALNKKGLIVKASIESGGGRNIFFIDKNDHFTMKKSY